LRAALLRCSSTMTSLRQRGTIDIASTEWTSILKIAQTIQSIARETLNKEVDIVPSNVKDVSHTHRNEPDLTPISAYGLSNHNTDRWNTVYVLI
jgi:ABC-type proline/glycine betaine transport system substrate-binding protein